MSEVTKAKHILVDCCNYRRYEVGEYDGPGAPNDSWCSITCVFCGARFYTRTGTLKCRGRRCRCGVLFWRDGFAYKTGDTIP